MAKKPIILRKKSDKKALNPTQQQILDLEAMIVMPGWEIIVRVMDNNISVLEENILSKSENGIELTELEVDRLRDRRGYLLELKNTPQNFIAKLNKGYIEPEEFDPYHKSASDIIADRRKNAR